MRDPFNLSRRLRIRIAMGIAVLADVLQLLVFPMFIAGAPSPVDDALDAVVGGAMIYLLGMHWEFLPSFLGKLVPGVDLVPFWSLAVANVYRKTRNDPATVNDPITIDATRDAHASPATPPRP
jgi:hypothetical protein